MVMKLDYGPPHVGDTKGHIQGMTFDSKVNLTIGEW